MQHARTIATPLPNDVEATLDEETGECKDLIKQLEKMKYLQLRLIRSN